MANIMTPSLMPGERSLPAELRTQRGSNFAQRRLAMGLQPSADPTMDWWRGMGRIGQDDDEENDTYYTEPAPIMTTPLDTSGGTVSFPWVTDPVATSAI